MKKEIKFSLVFRDMWQSAGKYVPRVDQLVKVAPAIIEMGCFARVETNGGGFSAMLTWQALVPHRQRGHRRHDGERSGDATAAQHGITQRIARQTGQNLSTKPVYKLICSIVLSTDFA